MEAVRPTMWKFKRISVSFMHLPDAREQFAASSSLSDLRLLLEDHHIVLSWNLTCSQELVLAHFPRKQKLWIQCPQELYIHISRVLASSSCPQGLLFCLISNGFWKHIQAPSAEFRSRVLFLVATPIYLLSTHWRTTNISLPPSPFSSLIYCISLHTLHQDIMLYIVNQQDT